MFGALFRNPMQSSQLSLPREAFNYKNSAHLEIIEKQISRFKESADALKALDYNIFLGVIVGSSCYFGSYLFPVVTISIASFSLAAHAHAKRPIAYEKYRQALDDLINTYNWSMGKNTGNHWHKLAIKTLQDLILTLGPCVAPEVIHTWTADDLKPNSLNPKNFFSGRRNDITEEFEKQLARFAAGTQVSELTYRIYGQHGLNDLWQTLKTTVASQVNNAALKIFNYQPGS
ncbi:hypothetical protein ACQUW5_11430 [Legionella sp. CNM-1927-20]|uniref:hypothetical protein n=1 Tax=Legionella sp. CNM-1927-20 TaxID=3422221 RepID=UPI00403AEB7F